MSTIPITDPQVVTTLRQAADIIEAAQAAGDAREVSVAAGKVEFHFRNFFAACTDGRLLHLRHSLTQLHEATEAALGEGAVA